MSGSVHDFVDLSEALGPDQPFYAVRSPPLHDLATRLDSVEALAEHYVEELRDVHSHGPYFIGGYSMGGRIAFAMARRLRDQGAEVGLLVLLDSRSYIGRRRPAFSERMARYLQVLKNGDTGERLSFLRSQIERSGVKHARAWARHYHRFLLNRYRRAGISVPEHAGLRLHLNQDINIKYVAPEYDGPAILIKVGRSFLHPDVHDGWRRVLTGDYRVHTVSGRHLTILKKPHVTEVADIITGAMNG